MKKVISIILLHFLIYFTSCLCSKKFSTTYITIHSTRALFYSFDKNGVFPYLEEFNRNELGIGILADSTSERIEISQLSSLINSAYACGNPHTVVYQNSIDSINIFTIYDFDDKHPANSNINDLLKPLNNMGETSNGLNIPDLKFTYQNFKFSEAPKFDSIQFLITGRISENQNFQIKTELVILK